MYLQPAHHTDSLVSIHQVDNVVKAVKERRDLDVAEARELK